jgi:hypothetical protein
MIWQFTARSAPRPRSATSLNFRTAATFAMGNLRQVTFLWNVGRWRAREGIAGTHLYSPDLGGARLAMSTLAAIVADGD